MVEPAEERLHEMETIGDAAAHARSSWYAAYTLTNHEKRVSQQLRLRCIQEFLPVYKSVHRWKDRKVWLETPLFPSYVFIRIPLEARFEVLRIPSVVRLVGFNGHPAALPDEEIDALRLGITHRLRLEPHPYLKAGRRVRIRSGPLEGREGFLVSRKANFRVVLSIELIMRSVAVEVDAADLEFPTC